ncbi:MAG: hypothetical protein DHS20C13_04600 [Thermodesulfobacteriota bacterium]|nr:MAG: hypothetical protein DHS20C13_04600 [Thermodesulfobacteriota bacterium]
MKLDLNVNETGVNIHDLSKTKLGWKIKGVMFQDGSKLEDWHKIEGSSWHWQYDDHDLTFDIYEHKGEFWKLYRSRRVPMGTTNYDYSYGGLACRMAQVRYKALSRSPHSGVLKDESELEWVRVEEVDEEIHKVLKL